MIFFCVFCGKKKKLTWPKNWAVQVSCSQKCAAIWAVTKYRSDPDTHYCAGCGLIGTHTDDCPYDAVFALLGR